MRRTLRPAVSRHRARRRLATAARRGVCCRREQSRKVDCTRAGRPESGRAAVNSSRRIADHPIASACCLGDREDRVHLVHLAPSTRRSPARTGRLRDVRLKTRGEPPSAVTIVERRARQKQADDRRYSVRCSARACPSAPAIYGEQRVEALPQRSAGVHRSWRIDHRRSG